MAKYKIYMVKLGTPRVSNETQTGTALKGYFDRVIQSAPALRRRFDEGAEVQWTTQCPGPAGHELLINDVTSAMDSIVVSMPGLSERPSSIDSDGLTVWTDQLTSSEVYTARFGTNPAMLAKLAFHEAMHNKTHRGANLHRGDGLAVTPLTEASQLTRANIRIMAGVLVRSRAQWTGGCTAYNDPLRGAL
jgi:hypothetical protein